jgi:alanine racemase
MDVKPAHFYRHDLPRLLISREAILHNSRLIRRMLRPGTKVCAMIKADAYGHGAQIIIDTLCNYQADDLPSPTIDMAAVACLDEASQLPEMPVPVLVLRPVENVYVGPAREAIEHAIYSGWILTLGTPSAADDVARIAMAIGRRAAVHVMVDTGMMRCGTAIDQLPRLLEKIESHSALRIVTLGSHLATSEVRDHEFVHEQIRSFHAASDAFASQRPGKLIRTVANSGGIFFAAGSHFDMVRPGISLYGIDPTCQPSVERPLKPAAKWVAPLVSILDAKKGQSVGYGQTFRCDRDTRIGLVPVGYADGYLRSFGNHAKMIVEGVAVPVVGRVSMDLATIDLHDVPHAQIGSQVTVMDDDPLSPASAYALSNLANSIPYELFTRIGPRVKRVAVESRSEMSAETRGNDRVKG